MNVSSDASFLGVIDHAAYCASKAALHAATRVMANELGPHGIRVNCVNPNITLTDMARLAWSDPARSAPRLQRVPIGRFLEPSGSPKRSPFCCPIAPSGLPLPDPE